MEKSKGSQGNPVRRQVQKLRCASDAHLYAYIPDVKKKMKAKIVLEEEGGRREGERQGRREARGLYLETNINCYLNIK